MSMNKNRGVLPSRSFISTRPSSGQLGGQRLTEFSLSAVFTPNGKIENQSLQLQWSEAPKKPSLQKRQATSPGRLYDELIITSHPSAATALGSSSLSSGRLTGCTTVPTVQCTTDAFASTNPSLYEAPSSQSSSAKASRYSKVFNDQLVFYVSVDLRIVYFEWPALLCRKQVVKEIRNDYCILEILQYLIKCAGIELNKYENCETGRLFCLRVDSNGKGRHEELDYLQWRSALLAEITTSASIQFCLDFTDTEDGTSSFASSSASNSNFRAIDMRFKEYK